MGVSNWVAFSKALRPRETLFLDEFDPIDLNDPEDRAIYEATSALYLWNTGMDMQINELICPTRRVNVKLKHASFVRELIRQLD